MKVDEFAASRAPAWTRLDELVVRAGRRPHRLAAAEVHELGELYRAAAGDLALARATWPGDPVERRLERLVARARPSVYTGDGQGRRLVDFVLHGYWRSVIERPAMLALAALLLFGSATLSGVWAWRDPDRASGLVPSQYQVVAEPHRYDHRTGPDASTSTALSADIMTNNIRVTFLAFGGGMLLCLGGVFLLLQNGVLLGVLAGLALGAGNGRPFFELILPHGVLELSCIVVSTAAGFRVGWAFIAPGHRTRGAALRAEARAAAPTIVGTACWLVVAGIVEAFVTPRNLGLGTALTIGFGLGGTFWALVLWLGRPERSETRTRRHAAVDAALEYEEAQTLAESFSFR